jgi:plastocyanin
VIRLTRLLLVFSGLLVSAAALFASSSPAAAATTTVTVGDFYFCSASFEGGNCQTTIQAGDTVVWDFSGADNTHTTTSDTSVWSSGNMNGGTFQFTFTQAGSFAYRCTIHPEDMRGTITVQAAASPTTAPAGQTPGQTTVPRATAVAGGGLPAGGTGPHDGSTSWWLLGALVIAGAMLGGAGLAYARRQR